MTDRATLDLFAAVPAEKRWHRREQRWVAPGRLFDPKGFAVDVAEELDAKAWIVEQHYSGTYPASRLAVGLYGPGSRMLGCAVFSVPMNQQVITAYTGQAPNRGAELGRFVCAPDVAYNGETWLLARAFQALRAEKPEIEYIVSYADPVAHLSMTGEVVKPEHWGTIYQASNALYVGRSSPRTQLYAPSGSLVSGRALSKLRLEERGWRYCYRQLIEAGAAEREPHESLAAWVQRVTNAPGFERRRHPGNLTYLFGLTRDAKAQLAKRYGSGQPYPRKEAA